MEERFDIFKHIAERTGGDVYIGVMGPVRTGKSTFIKRFMELLVLPNIDDPVQRERALDSLPQSAAGRTVMTTEPKFVPDDGVEITVRENITFRVRMVDCVGYAVPGALGYEEDEGPRMVMTPWFDEEIPFQEAAEIGTKKVMTEHSTIGVLVTTDGTITEIPRDNYISVEERMVEELKAIGKPFVVVLNSVQPYAQSTTNLAEQLEQKYNVSVIPVDCLRMTVDDIQLILEQVLYEFPVTEVNVRLPSWVEVLDPDHWLKGEFEKAIEAAVGGIRRLRDVEPALEELGKHEFLKEVNLERMDLGTGVATIGMVSADGLFYRVLGEIASQTIDDDGQLLKIVRDLMAVKREYSKVANGLKEVWQTGYGMVPPSVDDLVFEEPELVRRGLQFGVRLRAKAPSLHLIRADIQTEVTPVIGTEKQSEELVNYLMQQFEGDPKKIWESDIFGKSVHDLLREGIQNKLYRMPENAQRKLQETLERIINEGSGGLICIII